MTHVSSAGNEISQDYSCSSAGVLLNLTNALMLMVCRAKKMRKKCEKAVYFDNAVTVSGGVFY